MLIKNNRIILLMDELKRIDQWENIKGGRHYKNMKGIGEAWSFPIDQMSKFRIDGFKNDIENSWYEIFPEFKFLKD